MRWLLLIAIAAYTLALGKAATADEEEVEAVSRFAERKERSERPDPEGNSLDRAEQCRRESSHSLSAEADGRAGRMRSCDH